MKLRRYPSLSQAASSLKKKGYSERFIFENNALKHKRSGRIYNAEAIAIVEYHRFFPKHTQNDDSSKVSIVFALETSDGLRGLLSTSYHLYGKVCLLEFMDSVKIKYRNKLTIRPLKHR